MEPKVVLVVPTIRENCILEFLDAWGKCNLPQTIVVEDNPSKTFAIDIPSVRHYSWEDIDDELREVTWIISRRTDCIRSFGFLKAAQAGADVIVTMDDDCLPILEGDPYFFARHLEELDEPAVGSAWDSTVEGVTPRGVPYFSAHRSWRTVANIGLWEGLLDLDAPTRLLQRRLQLPSTLKSGTAVPGKYLPMCGMNLAFRVELLPAMYFLLMGRGFEFDRFGDIWCGILVKRICDHLRLAMRFGPPCVYHSGASNVFKNLKKESAGLRANEYFWQVVDGIVLTGDSVAECYRQLAKELPSHLDGEYWKRLGDAMLLWLTLMRRYNG